MPNICTEEKPLDLHTGKLTFNQIDLILRHLPVDISFIDFDDKVLYYSDVPERIFPRSPGVIDRKVKNCHPPKSQHIVQRIIDEFRAGTKDHADFWIHLGEKFVYIRYFAVRNDQKEYQGTLEVSQDITVIHELQGEQRLLDWDNGNPA
jgi:DUF438 domain-containing protein